MRKHTTKTQTPTAEAPVETAPKAAAKAAPMSAPKAAKPAKVTKAKTTETADRLPGTLGELKETKGGLVAFLFLSGRERNAIATEVASAFKIGEKQATKITRRITARVRLYQRIFSLVPASKA